MPEHVTLPTGGSLDTASPPLLDALQRLNRIGATINRIGAGDPTSTDEALRLIVTSATDVLAGASAVMYTYDDALGGFDAASRVSAGELGAPATGDAPRGDGLGMRAVHRRHRILSYEEGDLEIHPVKAEMGAKAVAVFPLLIADAPVGVLYVYLRELRRFSELELLMLESYVNQAATALDHARRLAGVRRDLARKEDEVVRMRRADLLISSRLRLEDTLQAILEMAIEVTNARYGIFRLLDSTGRFLVTRAFVGADLGRPATEPLPLNTSSITGWVAKHRQPLCIEDLHADPWVRVYYPLDREREMRAELAVPLVGANGRLEGVINLESPVVGAFSEDDSRLLQGLATQASIAIQQARLLDTLQEMAGRLLFQPCQEVLDRLAGLACELLDAAAGAIWTPAGDNLALAAGHGFVFQDELLPLHGSLTGLALLRREPVVAADVRHDPRFGLPDLALEHGWVGSLVVPILASDQAEPLGAFSVYSTDPNPARFSESDWDKKVLTILGHYAGLALQDATHRDALRIAQEQRAVAETFAAMGDVAANLLHHLNNKVGTIPVRVEGIEDKCQAVVQANPYLATNLTEIERSATEAMEAVRESLSLLRPIELVPVSVAACVTAAQATISLPRDVQVTVRDLDRLPPVRAAQQSLVLVIVNLLQNAADAMRGKGTIQIRGAVRATEVEIRVDDSGPGIAPALHERIFEFDFSGPGSGGHRSDRKLGFGLWWVKTLMARLGGSISVDSDGRSGTTFRLRLPAAEK